MGKSRRELCFRFSILAPALKCKQMLYLSPLVVIFLFFTSFYQDLLKLELSRQYLKGILPYPVYQHFTLYIIYGGKGILIIVNQREKFTHHCEH